MHLKLRDQQLKIITYIERLLYKNFMVATNQKPIVDAHTKTKRNPNRTLKTVIKSQENRTKEEERSKKPYKTTLKQLTGWQ